MSILTDPTARIVYVEDEPSIAKLLVSGLSLFGIEVHPIYASAEELLETATDETFKNIDMFFFDIRLPRMTGVELAQELRTSGEKRPFVLVSAWPSPPSDELSAINAEFLPKPFDFPDVIKTIQSLMSEK